VRWADHRVSALFRGAAELFLGDLPAVGQRLAQVPAGRPEDGLLVPGRGHSTSAREAMS
jgi:hypothetical protein